MCYFEHLDVTFIYTHWYIRFCLKRECVVRYLYHLIKLFVYYLYIHAYRPIVSCYHIICSTFCDRVYLTRSHFDLKFSNDINMFYKQNKLLKTRFLLWFLSRKHLLLNDNRWWCLINNKRSILISNGYFMWNFQEESW